MRITDELAIEADPRRVWELTVDVESWPQLTATITSVTRLDEGPLAVGSTARIVQPKQRPRIWTVTRLEVGRLFEWRTTLGWLTMVGRHRIEPVGTGCRNVLDLDLEGFGAGPFGTLAGRQFRAALHTENAGFKKAAEQTRQSTA